MSDRYAENDRTGVKGCSVFHAFKLFWTHFFDFHDCSTLSEFWWWKAWEAFVIIVLNIIGACIAGGNIASVAGSKMGSGSTMLMTLLNSMAEIGIISIISGILFLIIYIPMLALRTRRFIDMGISPMWCWIIGIGRILFFWSALIKPYAVTIYFGLVLLSFIFELCPSNALRNTKKNKSKQNPKYVN